jgi:hypothetical protein
MRITQIKKSIFIATLFYGCLISLDAKALGHVTAEEWLKLQALADDHTPRSSQRYPLGAGRVIHIQRFKNHFEIEDTEGPSRASHFALWQYGRRKTRSAPFDVKNWENDPSFDRLKRLRQKDVGTGRIYPIPGDKALVRLYDLPRLGRRFSVRLRTDSLTGWEHLEFLSEEALALAAIELDIFIKENQTSLIGLYKDTLKKIEAMNFRPMRPEEAPIDPESDQVRDRFKHLQKLLCPYLDRKEYADIDYIRTEWGPTKMLEHGLARRLREGRYVPLIEIQRHIATPFDKPMLLVVHAHEQFVDDKKNRAAIEEMEKIVAQYKLLSLPVIYLMSGDTQTISSDIDKKRFGPDFKTMRWVLGDRNPTAALFSNEGHHALEIPSYSIAVVGAFWLQCHFRATLDAIVGHFRSKKIDPSVPLKIHLPERAIVSASIHFGGNIQTLMEGILSEDTKEAQDLFVQSLDIREFTFKEFEDGKLASADGSGTKVVEFHTWTGERFLEIVREEAKGP